MVYQYLVFLCHGAQQEIYYYCCLTVDNPRGAKTQSNDWQFCEMLFVRAHIPCRTNPAVQERARKQCHEIIN